jgi:F0F1-type ATP synthase membrane subunit b/b'
VQLIFFTINFITFLVLLVFLLKKPLSKYLKERKEIFVNGHIEAEKNYSLALCELNNIKDDIKNIEQKGNARIAEVVAWSKSEADSLVLNSESYSKSMLDGNEEMITEETKRVRDKTIANFIHKVISNTERDVKKGSPQVDYDSIYIKDYFTESKRMSS